MSPSFDSTAPTPLLSGGSLPPVETVITKVGTPDPSTVWGISNGTYAAMSSWSCVCKVDGCEGPRVFEGKDQAEAEWLLAEHHRLNHHHEIVCPVFDCFYVAAGESEDVSLAVMQQHATSDHGGIYLRHSDGRTEIIPETDPPIFVAEPDPVPPTSTEEAPSGDPGPLKIAIVGYTPSRSLAPYGDAEWELWGMNNLHMAPDIDARKFGAWFDLHDLKTIRADAPHHEWIRGGCDGIPLVCWERQEDWPTSTPFPVDDILREFPRYFTNSVSWMMAFAIMLLKARAEAVGKTLEDCTIGVWGIDMATDSEYAAQRPSCELVLGIAIGLGIKVNIPESSDLMKAGALYGMETSPMQAKIEERVADISAKMATLQQQRAQAQHDLAQIDANLNAGNGALDFARTLLGTWFQPVTAGKSTHESSAFLQQ